MSQHPQTHMQTVCTHLYVYVCTHKHLHPSCIYTNKHTHNHTKYYPLPSPSYYSPLPLTLQSPLLPHYSFPSPPHYSFPSPLTSLPPPSHYTPPLPFTLHSPSPSHYTLPSHSLTYSCKVWLVESGGWLGATGCKVGSTSTSSITCKHCSTCVWRKLFQGKEKNRS